ncbi:MAG TPA: hypothetical protein IAB61_13385 [Candidatus Merdisoma merdipullorum]|nr:hypothetical protein [Candidatus Merdisoma merdipullorum]
MKRTWMKCCACILSAALLLVPVTASASEAPDVSEGAAGETPESEPEETPGNESEEMTGNDLGVAPMSELETTPANESGTTPTSESGTEPGATPESETGTTPESESGTATESEQDTAAEPGTETPATDTGTETPATDTSTEQTPSSPEFTFTTSDGTEVTLTLSDASNPVLGNDQFEITEENINRLLPAFLRCYYEEIVLQGESGWCQIWLNPYTRVQGVEVTGNEYNDFRIVVDEESAELIRLMREAGHNFMFAVSVYGEYGETIYYKNIEGPTTLGFRRHENLDVMSHEFYGAGFDVSIMDDGYWDIYKVDESWQLLYPQAGGGVGKIDSIFKNIQDFGFHVEAPGLHLLVPVSAENTEAIGNTMTIASGADPAVLGDTLSMMMSQVENSLEVTLEGGENYQINQSVFETLAQKKETGGTLTFAHGGLLYSFAAADITDPAAVAAVTLGASVNTETVQASLGGNVRFAIDFAHSGKLPGRMNVTIPVELADGTYGWYYLNPETNALEEGKNVTVSGGTVTAPLEHCSTYVLTAGSVAETPSEENGNTPGGEGSDPGHGSDNGPSSPASSGQPLTDIPKTGDSFPLELLLLVCAAAFVVWRKTRDEKAARS